MTVHPGKGGQKFMPECLEKVKDLRTRFPGKNIQVDGGVGTGNACQCAQAGESLVSVHPYLFDRSSDLTDDRKRRGLPPLGVREPLNAERKLPAAPGHLLFVSWYIS